MGNKNDINLDTIQTKVPSDLYKSNWERIFGQTEATPANTPETTQKAPQNDQPRDLS